MEVPWNFAKFIVDGATGQVVSYYIPRIAPNSLRAEIAAMLAKGPPYVPDPDAPDFGGLVKPGEVLSGGPICGIKDGDA